MIIFVFIWFSWIILTNINVCDRLFSFAADNADIIVSDVASINIGK